MNVCYFLPLKKRKLHDMLAVLPTGQHQVAWALVEVTKARTYLEVAEHLGVHVGTVYRHLSRIRQHHPEVYAAVMVYRRAQLDDRHERALARTEVHSRHYFRRKTNYRYFERFGCWPWERW